MDNIKNSRLIICVLLTVIILPLLFSGCGQPVGGENSESVIFTSFRDIPGITDEEIAAIEALREQTDYFVYGMMLSPEAFENADGEIRGYTALFCEWLTELFEIPFRPRLYNWVGLRAGLESGEVSFTGEMTRTEERLKTFHMTNAIASRPFMYFRAADSEPPAYISETRPLRFAFLYGATTLDKVSPWLTDDFEIIWVNSLDAAYAALESGEADAFIGESTAETAFDALGDIVKSNFSPLLFSQVSLTAQNSLYEPIISAVQKALDSDAVGRYLAGLHNAGYLEYQTHKMFMHLTEDERRYIQANPVVYAALETSNYPISFYNERNGQWQGIAIDVLHEIETLTGLRFERANDENASFADLLIMVEAGEASLISEALRSPAREDFFLWPDMAFMKGYFALISRSDYPNVTLNKIFYTRVGVIEGYTQTAMFRQWFPDHSYTIEYESTRAAFDALNNGEVDLVMASTYDILVLTHFLERTGYKVNFQFDHSFESTFMLNRDEVILQSIINKAMSLINVDAISDQWVRQTFDYQLRLAQARMPWIIGAAILVICVLVLTVILFIRSRRVGKRLERLVSDRTSELEKQTHDLALQTSLFTAIFDSSPDLIFCKNLELRYTRCNKSLLHIFDFREEDIIGKTDEEVYLPHIAEKFALEDRKVISEKRHHIFEGSIKPRFGQWEEQPIETLKAPLLQNGEVIGLLGISRDITKHKEMERALMSNYEYAGKLSDALTKITKSPAVFAGDLEAAADVITREGCVALNVQRVGVWKLVEEEKVLKSISYYGTSAGGHASISNYDMLSDPDYVGNLKSARLIVINSISEHPIEAANPYNAGLCAALEAPIHIDGQLFGAIDIGQESCEQFPEKREWTIEEQNFASSLADLMAIVVYSSERHKARVAADNANLAKSEFLANMSHEIRTPMNSIVGFSELAMDDEIAPRTREYLTKIKESSEWLLQVVNDILDISKVESGKMELESVPFDLHDLFFACRTIIAPKADEKGIELYFYAEPTIGKIPLGDPTKLLQVFVNLLSNAVKFTDSGKISLKSVIKEMDEKTVTVYAEVKDTGIGMTSEQIEGIFNPFVQAESGTTRKYGGTGLGLAITKNIIEMMGGKLSVESEPGVGSKFSFELTLDTIGAAEGDVIENKITLKEQKKPTFEGEILVCEDNVMNQQVICDHLARVGLKTVVAENGQIGVDMVRSRMQTGEKQFDLILMDIHMPVMDGLEAAEKIFAMGTDIPIVAVTANIMSHDRQLYRRKGISNHVGKPFTSRELWSCLKKYLPVKSDSGKDKPYLSEEDEMLQEQLSVLFVKSNQTIYSEIMKAVGSGDIKLAHRLTHSLKGNAGQIGEKNLQAAAAAFESKLSGGENLLSEEEMRSLETELKFVLEKLTPLLTETGSKNKAEPVDAEKILELLEKLEPMLKEKDTDCLTLLDQIRAVPEMEELVEQIEDYNFKQALKTLETIKKNL